VLSLPPVLIFPLSIGALFWGSDQFIRVAVEFAQRYKINRMLVGVVIVGILTAIPELIVSLMASMDGKVGIALGNAIGS
jgi:cation:H+ antiporter